MNPLIAKGLYGAATGFVSAAITDLDAFIKARTKGEESPNDVQVQFDWALAVARWIKGTLYGAMTGLGIGGVEQLV